MMNPIIEFVLDVEQEEFNQWLESYLPDAGRDIIYLPDAGEPAILEFYKEGLSFQGYVYKISLTPQRIRKINNICQYEIPVQIGKLHTIDDCQYHDIFLLSTNKIDKNSTLIKIDYSENELRPYSIDLITRIMVEWPKSKRKLIRKIPSPFERKSDIILFEFIIDTNPDEFFDWLDGVIRGNPTRRFLENIGNRKYETLIHGSEVFIPCPDMNYWEFLLLASTKITQRDVTSLDIAFFENFNDWNIARIELKRIHDESLYLICYADYEGFDYWISALENKIRLSFTCINIFELPDHHKEEQPDSDLESHGKRIIDESQLKIRLPKTSVALDRWKATWNAIKEEWYRTGSLINCQAIIDTGGYIQYSSYTIMEIINAGRAGKLD